MKKPVVLNEFSEFLREYKIVPLAIAFVMGTASTALVNSLVKDVIMPIVGIFFFGTTFSAAVFHLGPLTLPYGAFLAELLNFTILAFIVFFVAKKVLKIEKEG